VQFPDWRPIGSFEDLTTLDASSRSELVGTEHTAKAGTAIPTGNKSGRGGVYLGMTNDSLRSFLAVPLAAVFLILFLPLFVTGKQPSMGLRVPVAHVRTFPFAECNDDRSVWVLLAKNGGIRINETPVSRRELKLRISEIYENREEPNAIFMLVDPEVSYGDFVDVYNEVSSANRSLHVGLVTDGLMALLNACPTGEACGLDWPDHKYIPWCLHLNLPPFSPLRSPGNLN